MATEAGTLTDDGRDAIVSTATDYIQSWLDGDAERMSGSLHPDLAKRSVSGDSREEARLESLSAQQMVAATAQGRGTRHAPGYEVTILDVYEGIASVMVRSVPYVDYLHVARFGERWLIVNALWQWRAGRGSDR